MHVGTGKCGKDQGFAILEQHHVPDVPKQFQTMAELD